MKAWKATSIALLAMAGGAAIVLPAAAQQAGTQFMGILGYRVGPYGANGAAFFTGLLDYLALVNERDGGINGVKLSWEECETEYNNAKGVECYERLKTRSENGPTAIHPMSTGITYGLIDKAPADKIPLITLGYGRTDATDGRVFPWVFPILSNYWDAATGIVKFIADKEGGSEKLEMARHAGEEYLLERHLINRLSTGDQVDDWITRFTYPVRWLYSAMNATDYFRAAALRDGVAPDARLTEAIDLVRAARQPDGTWLQGRTLPGAVWFEIDVKEGEPSPWLTFSGTRVLDWWDAARA